ncbi:ferric iron reductase, partial [Bacillus altitudinis]|uniref:ferric iron reductase n=1 Tax=Bacillus altitudinis TaxID=293387 RepID=UPI0023553B8B
MSSFFHLLIPPLLHFIYQYPTLFSPHPQNTILLLKHHNPHPFPIKHFLHHVNISHQPLPQ